MKVFLPTRCNTGATPGPSVTSFAPQRPHADVNDVTDHGAGNVRPDAEDLGNRHARRLDCHLEAHFGLSHLGVDAAQVGQQVVEPQPVFLCAYAEGPTLCTPPG